MYGSYQPSDIAFNLLYNGYEPSKQDNDELLNNGYEASEIVLNYCMMVMNQAR